MHFLEFCEQFAGTRSVVGGTIGNLIYALHFDGAGRPRRRHAVEVAPSVSPGNLGLAVTGRF